VIALVFWISRNQEPFCNTKECVIDNSTLDHLKNILKTLVPEATNYSIQPGKESVTVNKENIYICMRNPNNGELYSFDILLYVTLHELSHVMSKTYSTKSHNDEFQTNFKKLLDRAYEKNFLPREVNVPDDYCKVKSEGFLNMFSKLFG
jgi:hypothetical protein